MRYLPHTAEDRAEMLKKIGVKNVDELFSAVPKDVKINPDLNLPTTQTEADVEKYMRALAAKNHAASDGPFFLGAGCYNHHIPATVDHVIQRSEFLTSYTPYQPEVSQGTLTVIFEFQSIIAALTGMQIANASMYDGATAVAEAALMAKRITQRPNVAIHGELHPHYFETLKTYKKHIGGHVQGSEPDETTACLIVQYPDFTGNIHDLEALRKKCDAAGCLMVVVVTEIVALGLLPAPSMADIVCGEGQSVGVGLQFGGPHVGFFATKKEYLRQMPGRLCGATVDAEGRRSFVLTLSTREQHIRREKATSNICTNVGLMATAFTIHMGLLGEIGFKQLAQLNHQKACELADALEAAGMKIETANFFNEFVVNLPTNAKQAVKDLAKKGIIAGYALDGNRLLVAATEVTSSEDIKKLVSELSSQSKIKEVA